MIAKRRGGRRRKQMSAKPNLKYAGTVNPRLGCPQPAKRAFDTKQAAAANAANIPGGHVYRCQCGAWHLTSARST